MTATKSSEQGGEVRAKPDTLMIEWLELNFATVGRYGYRGRSGWEVTVADPGGHYLEERIKQLGSGRTWREAVKNAMSHATPPE